MQEPPCRRDIPRFPLSVTIPARPALPLDGLSFECILDRGDDAVRVVPLAVDPEPARRVLRWIVADEDDRSLRPAGPRDIRQAKAFADGVRVDDRDVRLLAADRVGHALRWNARDDLDSLPVEQEPDELEVALVAAREHDGAPTLRLELHTDGALGRLVGRTSRPGHAVAERQSPALALAGPELDDLAGAPAGSRLERRQVWDDLDHDLIGVEEDDVDREAHERRVDRPGGRSRTPCPDGRSPRPSRPRSVRLSVESATTTDSATTRLVGRSVRFGTRRTSDSESLEDADHDRHEDHDEERRHDQEEDGEEDLDRRLLRALLRVGPLPLPHLEREVAHDLTRRDTHRLALRDRAHEHAHTGGVDPLQEVLQRLDERQAHVLLLQRQPHLGGERILDLRRRQP